MTNQFGFNFWKQNYYIGTKLLLLVSYFKIYHTGFNSGLHLFKVFIANVTQILQLEIPPRPQTHTQLSDLKFL